MRAFSTGLLIGCLVGTIGAMIVSGLTTDEAASRMSPQTGSDAANDGRGPEESRRRRPEHARVEASRSFDNAIDDGGQAEETKDAPATGMDGARVAGSTPSAPASDPPTEHDLVAGLVSLDSAKPGDIESSGRSLVRTADDMLNSGEPVRADVVIRLLRHPNRDARMAGAMLLMNADAPLDGVAVESLRTEDDRDVRRHLVEALPYLGELGVERAVELVGDGHPSSTALVTGLIDVGHIDALLARPLPRDTLAAVATQLSFMLDDTDQSRRIADVAMGRLAELVSALADDRAIQRLLNWMASAGQSSRVASLAFDPTVAAATKVHALDVLNSDDHWRLAEDTASRVLASRIHGMTLRVRAVEVLEDVARRDEADRRTIVSRLGDVASGDPSPEVRHAAKKSARWITANY